MMRRLSPANCWSFAVVTSCSNLGRRGCSPLRVWGSEGVDTVEQQVGAATAVVEHAEPV
jgi:hypothetical protein